jgi:flagellar hook-associated protein 3 FlgL
MAILPLQLARVSNLLRTGVAQESIARTQADLLRTQNELSTGKRLNAPSDGPGDAAVVLQLQKTLEQRKTYSDNIDQAGAQLGEVDSTLGDLTELLKQAQTIASANVGSDVSADQRTAAAAVVHGLYQQAISLGNKQFNGTYLFAGDKGTDAPFVATAGGVKFVGSSTVLANQVDENASSPFMVDGAEVFGALSTRVQGTADLTPQASAQTRLADLRSAGGAGVRLGPIVLGNGATTKVVDLSKSDTLGDVVNAINAAGVGGITATIGAGGAITLTTTGADNITVADVTGGTTAADLGILRTTGAGAGAALNGAGTQPLVTPLTKLSDLRGGAGIDTAGLIIKNGSASATIPLTSPPLKSPATIEDLLNAINGSGAQVLARINAAGTGIDIVNPNQGTQMTIAENGGTTAADLGVRSLAGSTPLSELNGGKGVQTVGGPDLKITRTDGTSFTVDVDGAVTLQNVIDRINAADTANGTQPAKVVAAVATTGNGISLTDSAGGGGALAVDAVSFSGAAADLGLAKPASETNTAIQGADVNPVAAQGIFANLARLRDSLKASDTGGITAAAEGLSADTDRVVLVRGETGARVQELESRKNRLQDEDLATKDLLSSLQDTDFTEAISRFETLQTSLQATLQATGRTLNLSLLDFLA